jgi:hypothetical protein
MRPIELCFGDNIPILLFSFRGSASECPVLQALPVGRVFRVPSLSAAGSWHLIGTRGRASETVCSQAGAWEQVANIPILLRDLRVLRGPLSRAAN